MFFTLVLKSGFSLESGWQQVSSGLQDSLNYSCPSHQCWDLNCLDSSSNLQFPQVSFPGFGDRSIGAKYNWYSFYLIFPLWFAAQRNPLVDKFSFDKFFSNYLLINTKSGVLAGRGNLFVSQSPSEFHFLRQILVCAYFNQFQEDHLYWISFVQVYITNWMFYWDYGNFETLFQADPQYCM